MRPGSDPPPDVHAPTWSPHSFGQQGKHRCGQRMVPPPCPASSETRRTSSTPALWSAGSRLDADTNGQHIAPRTPPTIRRWLAHGAPAGRALAASASPSTLTLHRKATHHGNASEAPNPHRPDHIDKQAHLVKVLLTQAQLQLTRHRATAGGSSPATPPRLAAVEGQDANARPHGPQSLSTAVIRGRLDAVGPQRVDGRLPETHRATAHHGGSATSPWPRPGWNPERTADSCPPHPQPTPPNAAAQRPSAGRARPHQPPGSADTLGRR